MIAAPSGLGASAGSAFSDRRAAPAHGGPGVARDHGHRAVAEPHHALHARHAGNLGGVVDRGDARADQRAVAHGREQHAGNHGVEAEARGAGHLVGNVEARR